MKKMRLDLQFFASGSIDLGNKKGENNNYLYAKIEWFSTPVGSNNAEKANNNKSSVTAIMYAHRNGTATTSGKAWAGNIKVNDDGYSQTKYSSEVALNASWKEMWRTTQEVAHNDDGTGSCTISGSITGCKETTLESVTLSKSQVVTLDIIPRATTLDSFSGNKRIGVANDVIINFTKKNTSFTTTLIYATKSDFSDAETIVDKSTNASTYSWTLPIELLNKIPNSKTLTIYVMLATFDGDTQIGTAQVDSFTANVYADNCRPIWETHTIEETDTTAKQLVTTANKFIANLSKPKFTFSAKGQYGATISYYQINNTTRSSGFTDSNFNTNGYTLKVVDSRGIENTYKFDLTYVPYFTPVFEEVKLFRDVPTSNKVFSYFKIKFFNNTSEVKFDNPQALSYKFNYQENGGAAQEKAITPEIYDDGTSRYADNEIELGDTFNYKKSVDWTFSFIDLTGKTFTTNATLPMGIPLMNGKMNDEGEQELFVNGETTFSEDVKVDGNITNTGNMTTNGSLDVSGEIINPNLDMYNDTSGSSWTEMMKNKLDYCVNNLKVTSNNKIVPINGGWSGVNYGFGLFSKIGGVYQLTWFSINVIRYCRKIGSSYEYGSFYESDTTIKNTYPVGSEFITSTNTNPNSFGIPGTWTLIDKEFSSVGPTNSGFNINTTNTTSATPYWSRSGHTLNLEIVFTNKVQINDNTVIVGNWNLETLGVTRLNHGIGTCGYTDAGNCLFMGYTNTLGEFSIVDLIPDSYISAGKTDNKIFLSVAIHKDYMLDSACDKFYWKRTA